MPIPGSKSMDQICGIGDRRRAHDAKFSLRVANFNSLLNTRTLHEHSGSGCICSAMIICDLRLSNKVNVVRSR